MVALLNDATVTIIINIVKLTTTSFPTKLGISICISRLAIEILNQETVTA